MKATNTSNYYKRLQAARESFAEWNQKRLEEYEKNPVDWDATVKTGKTVFKKSK